MTCFNAITDYRCYAAKTLKKVSDLRLNGKTKNKDYVENYFICIR